MLNDIILKAGFLNQMLIHGLHILVHGGPHVLDCFIELALGDKALTGFGVDVFLLVSLIEYAHVEFIF